MNENWRSSFGWSFSKSRQWNSCRRQFFYYNIKRHDPDEDGRRIRELAALTSLNMLAGMVVHAALSEQLARAAAGGRHSAAQARRFADWRFYERFSSGAPAFLEQVNGLPFREGDKGRALDIVHQCLANFYRSFWPEIAQEKYVSSDQGRPVKTSIAGSDVYLAIDYLSRNGQHMIVRDWKTGGEKDHYAFQVATYALHVERLYGTPLDNIRTELIYLPLAKKVAVPLTSSLVDKVKDRIVQESRDMLACAGPEDFPAEPDNACFYCNFATFCPDGRAMLG